MLQRTPSRRRLWQCALASSALSVLLAAAVPSPYTVSLAYAQSAEDFGITANPDAQLLLQADELIYDNDTGTVVAIGDVQVEYDGNRLVADRITYVESTGRLIAQGGVELLQPDGTRTLADELDITDDFANGFVNGLRVTTTDDVRFAAESAERVGGTTTIFNNGIYSPCVPCQKNPDRPLLWQIKSQKIIWNGEEKTIRFENARFEFLGVPIAYVPVFTTSDPTVRRKTGFLAPSFGYDEDLGFSAKSRFFWNLAPNYDLTFSATGYTEQGFLGEVEWRHRLENGQYNLKMAGIHQLDPDEFAAGTINANNTTRGMIGTKGEFQINPRWTFGWNGLLQSDKNFSRTYSIDGFNSSIQRNEIYLTGLEDRSYFDARFMNYDVQQTNETGSDQLQTAVLPSFDYERTFENVAGGELTATFNSRNNLRDDVDQRGTFAGNTNFATRGLDGFNGRTSIDLEWDRQFITDGGLVITPTLAAQGDAFYLDTSTSAATGPTGQLSATNAQLTGDDSFFRGMVTAGIEARWPILFSTESVAHVVEPIAQVWIRPNEQGAGILPNEDAQSFVFDTTNLFSRDKFSGFDRVEGGIRANVGLRYTGTFDNGVVLTGLFGQSYHLGGENSFAKADFVNAGADSGLETDVSDFVGSVGIETTSGLGAYVGARFDERTFEARRVDAGISFQNERFRAALDYARQQAQPTYAQTALREEVTASATVEFIEGWSVGGFATYDIADGVFDRHGVGLQYSCECFDIALTYSQDRNNSDQLNQNFGLRFSLKTIGDFGVQSDEIFE
ncbi:MAG: LPS-assembly protein LptD [Pseudomonadota bacterium]